MKALNAIFGALVVAALPPLPRITQTMPAQAPAPVAQIAHVAADPLRLFPLNDGVNVALFSTIDGKLTSRLYRAQA